jgi:hypothetical protein
LKEVKDKENTRTVVEPEKLKGRKKMKNMTRRRVKKRRNG